MIKSDLLLNELKDYLIEYFVDLGIESPEIVFDKSSFIEHGDLSNNAALKYAREVGKKPSDIALGAINWLKKKSIEGIGEIKFAPPGYINIFFNTKFIKETLEDIFLLGNKYGSNEILINEKLVIEHTSPNPNKAMHLGHLRNNLVGMSISRLLEFCGATIVCDSVDNNRGIAIAKLMWGFLAHMKKNDSDPTDVGFWFANQNDWFNPSDLNITPDKFVAKCYVLGEGDFKSDNSVEEMVRDMVVKWEKNDLLIRKLWEHVLEFSYEGINRTLARIGNRWDKVWHEHEHYQKGKEYVMEGLERGIFIKLEDGAVLTNLAKYDLPDTILLKNDGTSLYITQDIALTALKKKEYGAKKLIWVIGPEQSIAMKQLFAVCEQLGIGRVEDFTHISYGYVGLKTKDGFKKMSSRAGTVVLIDDMIDMVKKGILEKLLTGGRSYDDTENLSEKMAMAAVKFGLLKVERTQGVSFDVEKSSDMQGDTGVYVLYTYARISSILRKASTEGLLIEPQSVDTGGEIVKKMAMFNNMILKALEDYSVHHLSQYLLQLCSEVNSWYVAEKILDGGKNQPHKLAVLKAASHVIKNGLAVLGIDVVEKI